MKIILSNVIEIIEPTDEIVGYFKKKLTYVNPEYDKKRRMGFWVGKTPREIKLFALYKNEKGNKVLCIPMGCFEELWALNPVLNDYTDYSITKKVNIVSNIKLRDYQKPCINAVKDYCNVIISMGCGMGKTLSALGAVGEIKEKTLWLAHTIDLINQAEKSCKDYMKCNTSFITNGKMDLSGDIVFATIQSVYKFVMEGKINQDEFGCIVLDECFPSGTKISTPGGYKNIENIKKGDYVYSYNHNKNKVEIKKVDYLFNKMVDTLVEIKLSNGVTFSCTENHPIFCNGKYIRADELNLGDTLYDVNFNEIKVIYIKYTLESDRGIKVYNIGVEDNHNYFVNDILVHNCHHLSSNPSSIQTVRTVFEYFPAKYRVGLSATIWRSDGLDKAITDIIGNVKYNIVQNKSNYDCMYNGKCVMSFPISKFQVPCKIIMRETGYKAVKDELFDKNGGTIIYNKLVNDITTDSKRNSLIINDLKKVDGSTIILSDRIEQLEYLQKKIENSVLITGSTPKKEREKGLEMVRNGKIKYLFSSFALAKEGLDLPILTNLFITSPIKTYSTVKQAVGRIQRPYEGKTLAVVYDYVDEVGIYLRYFKERRTIYRNNNWEIENMYISEGVKK